MAQIRGRGEGTYYKDGELFAWRLKTPTGNIVRKAKTQKDLRKKVKQVQTEIEERGGGLTAEERATTIAGWLNRWLETYVKPHRAAKTYRQYEQLVRLYMVPLIGKKKMGDVRGADVQDMLNALTDRGLSSTTVGLVRSVFRRALNVAKRQKLILSNPVEATERPKAQTRRERAMTPEQRQIFIAALESSTSRYAPLLTVLLATGVRIGEGLGLRECDLINDSGKPAIFIQEQLTWAKGGTWSLERLKTARSVRTVPLNRLAKTALERMKAIRSTDQMRLGAKWPGHDFLFVTETGKPTKERNVQRALDAILSNAELGHFSLHDLRRTFGTTLANKGVAVHVLQTLMGHESITTTLTHYVSAYRDGMSEAVDLVE